MTLTSDQITLIVGALVGLVVALSAYLNHLANASSNAATSSKIDLVSSQINGQGAHLTAATTEMIKQSAAIAATLSATPIPPAPVAPQPNPRPGDPA